MAFDIKRAFDFIEVVYLKSLLSNVGFGLCFLLIIQTLHVEPKRYIKIDIVC